MKFLRRIRRSKKHISFLPECPVFCVIVDSVEACLLDIGYQGLSVDAGQRADVHLGRVGRVLPRLRLCYLKAPAGRGQGERYPPGVRVVVRLVACDRGQ